MFLSNILHSQPPSPLQTVRTTYEPLESCEASPCRSCDYKRTEPNDPVCIQCDRRMAYRVKVEGYWVWDSKK